MKFVIPVLILAILIIGGIWLKRKRKFSDFPLPWRKILKEKVAFYSHLKTADKRRFEKDIQYFLSDVRVTGVGLEVNDLDRILVASSAVIPLFGFPELRYRNISEVLLYKDSFNEDHQTEGEDRRILGKVGSGTLNRQMILSRPALIAGFENTSSKTNVGIHEFIHLIDKADGAVDGIPESIMEQQYVLPWLNLMHEEIDKIRAKDSDINPYGGTSKIEFFSVASEYFFKRPKLFRRKHPELYNLLSKIFNQQENQN